MFYLSNIHVVDIKQRLIAEELNYDKSTMHDMLQQYLPSLIDEQRHAYDTIVNAIDANKGGFFFVYGYGGTEKPLFGTHFQYQFAQGVILSSM